MDQSEPDYVVEKLACQKIQQLKEASNTHKMKHIEDMCDLAIASIDRKKLLTPSLTTDKPSTEKMLKSGVSPMDVNFNYRFSRPWNPQDKIKKLAASIFGIGALSPYDYENVTSEKILDAPIVDICIIQKSEVVPDGYYRISRTPSNKKADLNTGSGGSHLFLCIKKSNDGSISPISALVVIYPDKKEYVPPGFSVVKRGGKPCNINAGTSAERIFLCFKRDASCNPITDLQVYFPSKQEHSPDNFVRLTRSVRHYPVDLNTGTGSHAIAICYRHNLKQLDCLIAVEKTREHIRSRSASASMMSNTLSSSTGIMASMLDKRKFTSSRRSMSASTQGSMELSEDWEYDREVKKLNLDGDMKELDTPQVSPRSKSTSPAPHGIREETEEETRRESIISAEDESPGKTDATSKTGATVEASPRDQLDSGVTPIEGEEDAPDDNSLENSSVVDPVEQRESMIDMGMSEKRIVTVRDELISPLRGLIVRTFLEGLFTTGQMFEKSLSLVQSLIDEVKFFQDDFEGHASLGMTLLDITISALCERLDGCVEIINNKILEVIHMIIKKSKGVLSKFSVQKIFRATTFMCTAYCTRTNWVIAGYPSPVQDDSNELYAHVVLKELIKRVTMLTENCSIDHVLPSAYDPAEAAMMALRGIDHDSSHEGEYHLQHLSSINRTYEMVVDLVIDFFDEVMDSVETSRVTETALLATAKKTSSTLSPSFWLHMNTISKTLFKSYEVQNAFILLAAICKWSWLGIKASESGEATPRHLGNKLLAIDTLREYCRVAGPNMRVSKIMGYQIRRLVVSSVFVNIQYALVEPRIFSKLIKLVSMLWENWREHIRLEFPVLCEQLIIKVLQAPPVKMPSLYHFIVLKEVMKWFEQPHMSVEMFVNFDMDGIVVSDWNIFSHIIRAVCSLAEKSSKPLVPGSGGGPWPSEASSVGSVSTMFGAHCVPVNPRDVKIKALEVTAHITRAIMDATGHANLIYMDIIANDKGEADNTIGGGWLTKGEEGDDEEDPSGDPDQKPVRRKSTTMINRREVNIKSAEVLQKAMRIYQEKESVAKAVKFLISQNFMSDTPHEIANFVRIYKDNFDPTAIGDFLGEGGKNPQEEQSWDMIRYRYTRAVSFVDTDVEDALRLYLTGCGFRMPGEAQKIDRFIAAFVKVYWQDNRNTEFCPFNHEDTVHLLSYAAIMLNTDLHRANLDKKKNSKKMSKPEFIKNLRGADQGQDIPAPYLERIYDNIASHPIEMAVDVKPTDESALQVAQNARDRQDPNVTDPESYASCVKELLKSLRNSEDLLRSLSPYTHRFYIMGVDISISLDLVSFMFESVWHNFHAIVDSLLTKMSNEENVIFSALDVLCNALTSCLFLDLKVEKIAYATQLARFRHICQAAESDEDGQGKAMSGAVFASGAFRKEKWFVSVEEATVETAITAIAEVHGVITQLKDVVKFCARREATKLVLARIEKKANLKADNRFIVMEGDLRKRNRSNKYDLYRFFLFSDILVYAHQGFSEFKVHGQLDLESTTVDGNVPDDASNCCFVINNPQKSFLVIAESHTEKQTWVRCINETLAACSHRKKGRRLSILDRMESQEIKVTERQRMHSVLAAKPPKKSSSNIEAAAEAAPGGEDEAIVDHTPSRWSAEKKFPARVSSTSTRDMSESPREDIIQQRSPFQGERQASEQDIGVEVSTDGMEEKIIDQGATTGGSELTNSPNPDEDAIVPASSRPSSSSRPDPSIDANDPMILEINRFKTPLKESDLSRASTPSPVHGHTNDSDGITSPCEDDESIDTPGTQDRSVSDMSDDCDDTPMHNCLVYVSSLSESEIGVLFHKALRRWKVLLDEIAMSESTKIRLYGLYRRSKDGVAPSVKATDDTADDKQWKAWQDFGSISTFEAMKRFITTVFSLRPDWDYKAK